MTMMLFSERIIQLGYFAYLLEFHNINCKKCSNNWNKQIKLASIIMSVDVAQNDING